LPDGQEDRNQHQGHYHLAVKISYINNCWVKESQQCW